MVQAVKDANVKLTAGVNSNRKMLSGSEMPTASGKIGAKTLLIFAERYAGGSVHTGALTYLYARGPDSDMFANPTDASLWINTTENHEKVGLNQNFSGSPKSQILWIANPATEEQANPTNRILTLWGGRGSPTWTVTQDSVIKTNEHWPLIVPCSSTTLWMVSSYAISSTGNSVHMWTIIQRSGTGKETPAFQLSSHPFFHLPPVCLYPSIQSIHPSIHPIYQSIHLSIQSINPSIQSINTFINSSIQSINPSIHPSNLSIHPSNLSIHLINPSIHPSTYSSATTDVNEESKDTPKAGRHHPIRVQ
jgi:hypothetical protein